MAQHPTPAPAMPTPIEISASNSCAPPTRFHDHLAALVDLGGCQGSAAELELKRSPDLFRWFSCRFADQKVRRHDA